MLGHADGRALRRECERNAPLAQERVVGRVLPADALVVDQPSSCAASITGWRNGVAATMTISESRIFCLRSSSLSRSSVRNWKPGGTRRR